jgi:type IV pilus assembly protein PilQ
VAIAQVSTGPEVVSPPTPSPVLIDLDFDQADLSTICAEIAKKANINFNIDPSVQLKFSIHKKQATVDEILKEMLPPYKIYFRKTEDGTYVVAPADPKGPLFTQLSRFATINLNYITAVQAQIYLKLCPYLQYMNFDPTDNVIVVFAPEPIIEIIRQQVVQVDIKKKQVLIEAIIIEDVNSNRKPFNIDWTKTESTPNKNGVHGISFVGMELGWVDQRMGQLLVTLRSVVTSAQAKIKAQPRLVCQDGALAEIFIGREQYLAAFVWGTSIYPTAKLEKVSSGIGMKIKPNVTDNDEVILHLEPEVSEVIGQSASGYPDINRRTVSTDIRVKDGETVIIAGLISDIFSKTRTKVPFLGDLPLVGFLFRSTNTEHRKSETMVLITPHILSEQEMRAPKELIEFKP